MVFLAILSALRPGVVDLNKASTRSNKQNLEEAFRVAEKELRIPRLLEPDGETLTLWATGVQWGLGVESVCGLEPLV